MLQDLDCVSFASASGLVFCSAVCLATRARSYTVVPWLVAGCATDRGMLCVWVVATLVPFIVALLTFCECGEGVFVCGVLKGDGAHVWPFTGAPLASRMDERGARGEIEGWESSDATRLSCVVVCCHVCRR